LAPNSTSPLDVEPEDIPVVPVPSEIKEIPVTEDDIVKPGETILVQTPKKRGRPKKAVLAGV
jgi:hypothetical protein